MDNEKNPQQPQDNEWLKEIFQDSELGEEQNIEPVAAPTQDDSWLDEILKTSELREEQNIAPVAAPTQDDSWLDNILQTPELGEELNIDETAVFSIGLTHPEDMELERIIMETKAEAMENQSPVTSEDFRDDDFRRTFGQGLELDAIFAAAAENKPTPPQDPVEEVEDVYVDEPELPEEEESEEASDANDEKPSRKRRPYAKKGYGLFGIPHLIATVIWLAIAVSIGVSLGRVAWVYAADMLAFGRPDQQIMVTIQPSDDLNIVAAKLKNAGLIKYPELFKFFVGIKGDTENLIPGTFTLNTLYDYNALVNAMKPHAASREEVEIMIPEGYTCAQIFAKLEKEGVCSAQDLGEYAANGELNEYWFLEGVPRGDQYCLEGYLFPDTYKFYTNDSPRRVLQKMLNAFDDRFTDKMKESLETVNDYFAELLRDNGYGQAYIDEHKLTLHKLVTIASIVEKESANSTESYTVASVFYNRLANPRNYPRLESDATVYYAIGGVHDGELTSADLQIDSPYNTYKYPGLIPGPIANPGQASLNAALDPDSTDYYFFFYDSSAGCHRFAKNLKEHNDNIDKYGD